jgi:hypothetical protein
MPVVPLAEHIRHTLNLDRCLLSPRSKFILDAECDGPRCGGFPICNKCFQAIRRGKRPKFAIANNYCFGKPPSCLFRLTDVELDFLAPVKTYGYSFCYTGGQKHKLVGSLSYYRVDQNAIVTSVGNLAASNANIVTLIYGEVTERQFKMAQHKRIIYV